MATILRGAVESGKKGISVTRYDKCTPSFLPPLSPERETHTHTTPAPTLRHQQQPTPHRFLKFYSRVADTVIDMYELGIPEGYMGLTKEEAVKRALALPEIQRPPLGIYYYSKKN